MKRIFNQAKRVEGRNGRIWLAYIAGASVPGIAEENHISATRVYQILEQCRRDQPPEEREEIRRRRLELLAVVQQVSMEMVLAELPPAFAPKGKPHETAAGEPVYDPSTRLAAIDRVLKIDERIAKATGTDAPAQSQVQLTNATDVAATTRRNAETSFGSWVG
jgi:hypothetical protein